MKAVPPITVWEGCDPVVQKAVDALSSQWGSYTTKSRRYPICRLLRELIDPAWEALRRKSPVLCDENLQLAWARYRLSALSRHRPTDMAELDGASELRHTGAMDASGLDGVSPLSVIAHRLQFSELDEFIKAVACVAIRQSDLQANNHVDIGPSLDTLREVAIRCRGKQFKRRTPDKFGKVELLHGMLVCRACERATELAAHKAAYGDALPEGAGQLSHIYCSAHSPKRQATRKVRADYQSARRTQVLFETELNRLERQYRGRNQFDCVRSGNPLVDEFTRLLVSDIGLAIHAEQASNLSREDCAAHETRLRSEARRLVAERMTDRKKEIVALLSSGLRQPQIAKHLGLTSRQAVSKAIQAIPARYRFDLAQKVHSSGPVGR